MFVNPKSLLNDYHRAVKLWEIRDETKVKLEARQKSHENT